ncbi:MAG: hypothetical protein HY308_10250 [Gammaproteobacteria bacterium]|nr:hypothetical protein [Gammaproteobacteria bacterium]
MKDTEHESTEKLIAQGWTMMFLAVLSIFLTEIMMIVAAIDLTPWQLLLLKKKFFDMRGPLALLLALYVFAPMLALTVKGYWFRWAAVGLTVGFTLIVGAHNVRHLLLGDKPLVLYLPDFAHHALGVWVTLIAIRWAREPRSGFDIDANVVGTSAV